MPSTIYIVRHAQGEHNVTNDWDIPDPTLTAKGKEQCQQLQRKFKLHQEVDLLITSPLRRAFQTAVLAFGPVLERSDVPALFLPLAQEVGDAGCDTGLEPLKIEQNLNTLFRDDGLSFQPQHRFDLSAVTKGWNDKTGYWAYTHEAVARRAADLRKWLFKQSASQILLVTHGAFMHFVAEDWSVDDPLENTAFKNCEVRAYTFTESSTTEEAHLQEIPGSDLLAAYTTSEIEADAMLESNH